MHDITNDSTSSKISELFIRSDQIHSHYTRFSAAANFHIQTIISAVSWQNWFILALQLLFLLLWLLLSLLLFITY